MRLTAIAFLLVFPSCRTPQEAQTYVVPASAPPMSCIIKGEILSTLMPATTDDSICSLFPCKARVRVTDIVSCGSSVSLFFNAGDTLVMQFAYTLNDTKKPFPEMKEHYPGLKKGDHFTTVVQQRMRPGSGEYFLIYGYKKE